MLISDSLAFSQTPAGWLVTTSAASKVKKAEKLKVANFRKTAANFLQRGSWVVKISILS